MSSVDTKMSNNSTVRMLEEPRLVYCSGNMDQRGFLNALELDAPAHRIYIVRNHAVEQVRAWHGHPKEWRMLRPMSGLARVHLLDMEDMANHRGFTLSAGAGPWLYVPKGWALGWMNLHDWTEMMFVAPTHYTERDDVHIPDTVQAGLWEPWRKFKVLREVAA